MTTFAEFVDCTGSNFNRAPLVAGSWRAVYVTGYSGVPETQAELAAARAAGVHLTLIDQQPGLPLFRIGQADVADIETGAATIADFGPAVGERRSRGVATHTSYCSFGILSSVVAQTSGDQSGIWRWVADYSWSATQSQNLLTANSTWGATQFGSPGSNPYTVVPGTSVNLAQAQFDIDMGNLAWMSLFAGGTPAPPVAPPPPPPPVLVAPAWPYGPFDFLDQPELSNPYCHSGYYSSFDNHNVATWQQRMRDRGWYYNGARLQVDGFFGPASEWVCRQFQAEFGLLVDGKVGPKTWAAAWTKPVTA
jgi:hypothetical protein